MPSGRSSSRCCLHRIRRDVPWSIHAARSSTRCWTCCAPAAPGASFPTICRPGKPSPGISSAGTTMAPRPRLLRVLRRRARQQVGRDPEPSVAIIDSQSIRTSPVRGTQRGYDGWKKCGEAFATCSLIPRVGSSPSRCTPPMKAEQKGARQLLAPLVDRFPR